MTNLPRVRIVLKRLHAVRLGTATAVVTLLLSMYSPMLFADVTPQKPETFLLTPGEASTLAFRSQKADVPANLEFVVSNYSGVEVLRGHAVSGADNAFTVNLKLPAGYYDLTLPAINQTFGVASLPVIDSRPDPFFCFDGALSWGAVEPLRSSYIAMLHRLNVAVTRERMLWGSVNSAPGKFDWEADKNYDTVRKNLHTAGLGVLEVCHDVAPYLREGSKVPYPFDLIQTAAAWGNIGARWQEFDAGIEAWNEPDIEFGADLPVDQYVPLVKTAAAGLRKAGVKTPLGGGVFTEMVPLSFLRNCGRAGMLDQVDFLTFHNYDAGLSIEPQVLKLRRWLKENRKESMPLWISECGMVWRTGPPRAPRKEDARSAMEICDKAVEARACGVSRYFPFVLFFYIEGVKNYSMTDKDGTPMRSLAAYGQCIDALTGRHYVGDLAKTPAGIQRARVFADDKDAAVVVLYSGAFNPGATTQLDFPIDQITGIDGRKLVARDGKLPIQDGLVYLSVPLNRIQPFLNVTTNAAALTAAAHAGPIVPEKPQSIVVQFLPDLSKLSAFTTGYTVTSELAAKLPFRIKASNFSNVKQTVTLKLASDLNESTAPLVAAYTKTVDMQPDKSAEAAWDIDLAKFGAGSRKQIRIVAESGGAVLDRLIVRVGVEGTIAEQLAGFVDNRQLPIDQLGQWTKNVASGSVAEMTAAEGHWSVKAKFDKAEKWVYPVFTPPMSIDFKGASGLLIRAKASAPGVVRVLVQEKNKSGYFLRGSLIRPDGQFHTVVFAFDDLSPQSSRPADPNGQLDVDQIESLMIGMHSEAAENSLEVSDLYVLGASK